MYGENIPKVISIQALPQSMSPILQRCHPKNSLERGTNAEHYQKRFFFGRPEIYM
jgi:hypothetical protein